MKSEFDIQMLTQSPLVWFVGLVAAAGLTFLAKWVLRAFTKRFVKFSEHTAFKWDDVIASSMAQTRTWFLFAVIFGAIAMGIDDSKSVVTAARTLMIIATCAQMIIWGLRGFQEWKTRILARKIEHNASSAAALGLISSAVQGLLVVCIVLIGLSNLGVDIGALITGLGIGGIAVALAAQNVLGDLLASLSIVLDKPFVIGDYIVAGAEEGEVENIGMKTTRVRSVSGEELIFSNKDLLESRVRNYKRMWRRRVVQKFSVSIGTPIEKMRALPGWVKGAVEKRAKLKFDRCHFVSVGDSAFNYELVFWVDDTNYSVYMDLQQELLLEILQKLESEKIDFGFPTRSLRVDQDHALEHLLPPGADGRTLFTSLYQQKPENRQPDLGHS